MVGAIERVASTLVNPQEPVDGAASMVERLRITLSMVGHGEAEAST